jgi:hypothetical protein
MKYMIAFALCMVACGGSSGGDPTEPSPPDNGVSNPNTDSGSAPQVSTYCYDASNTSGECFSFWSNGNYVLDIIALTSDTSANAQIETGTYTRTGSEFSFTPEKWTCAHGALNPFTVGYTLSGDNLILDLSTGVLSLTLDTTPAATNFDIVDGCFEMSGFVSMPLQ